MSFRVLIQPPAAANLDEAYRWIAERSPGNAAKWVDGIYRAIQTLSSLPGRCPLAPEDEAFETEIRQLFFGDYRVLFTIDGTQVRVLHVRHAARRPLSPDEAAEEDI